MAIFAQKDPSNENPGEDDLFEVGSMIEIIKHVKMPGNKLSVVIRGVSRIRMRRFYAEDDCLRAEVEVIDSSEGLSSEDEMSLDQLVSELQDLAQRVFDLSPQVPSEASFLVRNSDDPSTLADIVAININIELSEKQDLLSTTNVVGSENMSLGP